MVGKIRPPQTNIEIPLMILVFEEKVLQIISRHDFPSAMSQAFFSCNWQKLTQIGWGKKGIPWLLKLKHPGLDFSKTEKSRENLDGCRFSNNDPAKPPLFISLFLFLYAVLFSQAVSFGWCQHPWVHLHQLGIHVERNELFSESLKTHSGCTWVICPSHPHQWKDWYEQHLNHVE